jgi:hypothetical protein
MAANPLVELDEIDSEAPVIEPDPSDLTTLLISAASGTAYHKNTAQKVKSFLGTKIRANAKGVSKQGISFALKHIPIAGPYVATGFEVAAGQAESKYKKWKAQKLQRKREADTDWEENMKAQLKTMSFQNAMSEIDQARKKVNLSATECLSWCTVELDTCAACTEAFYHWYRLEHRARKLKMKVAAVRIVLKALEKYADTQLRGAWQARSQLIASVNEFTENHVKDCAPSKLNLTYFKDVCLIAEKGQKNLESKNEKGSLIT